MEQVEKLIRIAVPVLLPVLVMVIVILWDKWRVYRNSKNPETTVTAEVIDRWTSGYPARRRIAYIYHIAFRPVDGGETKEFEVGEAEYKAYHLGDQGPLTYRTWEFISFRPESRSDWENDVPVAFADEEEDE